MHTLCNTQYTQRIDAPKNATSASPISNRCTEEIFNQLGWVFSPILFALFIAIASTPAANVYMHAMMWMQLKYRITYRLYASDCVMCDMAKKRRKKQGNANMFLSLFCFILILSTLILKWNLLFDADFFFSMCFVWMSGWQHLVSNDFDITASVRDLNDS